MESHQNRAKALTLRAHAHHEKLVQTVEMIELLCMMLRGYFADCAGLPRSFLRYYRQHCARHHCERPVTTEEEGMEEEEGVNNDGDDGRRFVPFMRTPLTEEAIKLAEKKLGAKARAIGGAAAAATETPATANAATPDPAVADLSQIMSVDKLTPTERKSLLLAAATIAADFAAREQASRKKLLTDLVAKQQPVVKESAGGKRRMTRSVSELVSDMEQPPKKSKSGKNLQTVKSAKKKKKLTFAETPTAPRLPPRVFRESLESFKKPERPAEPVKKSTVSPAPPELHDENARDMPILD